ncbi:LLM class flavin-dependent oxidoreductase, partial [Streptomyces sp. NPDC059083]|uniref:LLM class flavin-dependent oxidoreductase n=1 Tax=Streptomyces sp. NPDC059083 TaxID=3346721 RepID=UPI00368369DB
MRDTLPINDRRSQGKVQALAQHVSGADTELTARVNDFLLPIVKGVGSERAYDIDGGTPPSEPQQQTDQHNPARVDDACLRLLRAQTTQSPEGDTTVHKELGTYGAWLNPAPGNAARIEYAPELEELGYDTIWVGIGPDPVGDMNLLEQMIEATRTARIASAIINMWQDDAHSIAHHYHRIVNHHGPRLLLGIGLGHPERRDSYQKPYERMVHYVDTLLEDRVPAEAIVIGALGTKTLKLAGERTLGAHPYLTVPEHTRYARELMGPNAFLAPEHKVVLTEDFEEARRIGRPAVQYPYLGLRNYTSNLIR